ncbi:MAG: cobalamin-dependent protein, partial [Clostridiales bacterium]|nr:cobalamin-dependent protein [Clostridiales bacterium]
DLIFDPLAMTISADTTAALATMQAVHRIRHDLKVNTSLGISNVSFGLPSRNIITSTFFALCLQDGLSAAIMNPYSQEMMNVYHAFRALHNMDENCMDYISYAQNLPAPTMTAPAAGAPAEAPKASGESGEGPTSELQKAIVRGLKEKTGSLTKAMLAERKPLEIIQSEVIPALNIVGADFEKKKVYLPQLLMAAEAAKSAFEEVKVAMAASDDGNTGSSRCAFVIATVHGDIHDIGKNIVKLILENYGFAVSDLGKDVPEQTVVDEVVRLHAPIVGLSALMTTTVPAMEETIKLLREQAPWAKVCVGGAVLTQEYSDAIGADKYCRDAMETVRYAEEIDEALKKQ